MWRKKEEMLEEINDDMEMLPLYYDCAFKVIFSKSTNILIKLLRKLLKIEISDTAHTMIGKEAVGRYIDSKNFRHDMVVAIDSTNYICIEVNANKHAYSINRNFIYLVDLLLSKLSKGLKVKELDNYKVRLLNLNMFNKEGGEVIDEAALIYLKSRTEATKMFKIIDLDIAKCYEMMYNKDIEKDDLIRWGSIFCAKTINELSDLLGDDLLTMEEKKEFLDNVRAANRDEELVTAWRHERNERWKRESIENGIREEGEEKGKEEEKISIIKSMLNEKLDYDFISKITGKTTEEVKEIENNM